MAFVRNEIISPDDIVGTPNRILPRKDDIVGILEDELEFNSDLSEDDKELFLQIIIQCSLIPPILLEDFRLLRVGSWVAYIFTSNDEPQKRSVYVGQIGGLEVKADIYYSVSASLSDSSHGKLIKRFVKVILAYCSDNSSRNIEFPEDTLNRHDIKLFFIK